MALKTVVGDPRGDMVRALGCGIVLPVAVYTENTRNIKPDVVFRLMTLQAVGSAVRSEQGETAGLVNRINIVHQPGS